MKLVVGLGNHGYKYQFTRHNIGFMVIDDLADCYNLKINKKDYNSLYNTTRIKREKVILAKPQTFVNKSGLAVRKIADYYNVELDDILVIHDDLDLETGDFKIKSKGGHGGHNGIKSIINHLSSKEFARIKLGIGKPDKRAVKDYVLGKFSDAELKKMNSAVNSAVKTIELFCQDKLQQAMNKFN